MQDLCLPDPLRQMYDELTCPLCSELYTDPYIFTGCSHAFCRACVLEKLEGKGITKMECPTCRQPGWKKDLVPNHKYQNLANILRLWTLEDGRSLTTVMHSRQKKLAKATAPRGKAAAQTPSESTTKRVQSRRAAAFKVPKSRTPDSNDTAIALPKADVHVPAHNSAEGKAAAPASAQPAKKQYSCTRGQTDSRAGTGQQEDPGPAAESASTAAVQAAAAEIQVGQAAPELSASMGKTKAGALNPVPGSGIRARERVVGRRGHGTSRPRTSSRFAAMAASTETPSGPVGASDCPRSMAMTKAAAKVSNLRAGVGVGGGAENPEKLGQLSSRQGSVLASANESLGKKRRSKAEEMGSKDAPTAGQAMRVAHNHKGEKENTVQVQQGLSLLGKSGGVRKEAAAKQLTPGSMSSAAEKGAVLEKKIPMGGAWVRGFFSEVRQAAEPTQLDPLLVAKEQSRPANEPVVDLATAEALSHFGPEWAAQARSQQALDELRGDPATIADKLEEACALHEAMALCEHMKRQQKELKESAVLVGTDRSMTQIDAHCNGLGIRFSESD